VKRALFFVQKLSWIAWVGVSDSTRTALRRSFRRSALFGDVASSDSFLLDRPLPIRARFCFLLYWTMRSEPTQVFFGEASASGLFFMIAIEVDRRGQSASLVAFLTLDQVEVACPVSPPPSALSCRNRLRYFLNNPFSAKVSTVFLAPLFLSEGGQSEVILMQGWLSLSFRLTRVTPPCPFFPALKVSFLPLKNFPCPPSLCNPAFVLG